MVISSNAVLEWDGHAWTALTAPNSTRPKGNASNGLADITCLSASECWAVGSYSKNTKAQTPLTQAMYWNGSQWSIVSTPNPGGTRLLSQSNYLTGVACASPSDCFAVGSYGRGTWYPLLNLALRWQGSGWSQLPMPRPAGSKLTDFQELYGVSCPTSSECWAVGDYDTKAGAFLNEVLHWDGTSWQMVAVPNPSNRRNPDAFQSLKSVTCSSATDCWAVGGYLPNPNKSLEISESLHWDGTRWTLVPTP